MDSKSVKYKCVGCGPARPCYVETNQEPSTISCFKEELKCILDETNQTGYQWEYDEEVDAMTADEAIAACRAHDKRIGSVSARIVTWYFVAKPRRIVLWTVSILSRGRSIIAGPDEFIYGADSELSFTEAVAEVLSKFDDEQGEDDGQ